MRPRLTQLACAGLILLASLQAMRCYALIISACLLAGPSVATTPTLLEKRPVPRAVAHSVELSAIRPTQRDGYLPRARWEDHPQGALWTRATMAAVQSHGRPLIEMVPADIGDWCPAYRTNGPEQRAAFWTGMISALVKHESTYRPTAVGGGGKWYGLTQILPGTARGYGCRARSGTALKDGAANLSCAVRIMATTVPRDGVVALKNGRSAGVGADWGPMTRRSKRADMAGYTKAQSYCRLLSSVRPAQRP